MPSAPEGIFYFMPVSRWYRKLFIKCFVHLLAGKIPYGHTR